MHPGIRLRAAFLTVIALCSFAANSILCRLALRSNEIDPVAFTSIRLGSGALLLAAIVLATQKSAPRKGGDWISGTLLWTYAAAFSFAYLGLGAGTGALILFGSVQTTMIGVGISTKDRPDIKEWLGLFLGLAGIVYLVLPSVTAPPLGFALLMAGAGAAWGLYTLRGKVVENPVAATAGNFLRSTPLALAMLPLFLDNAHITQTGATLAVVSGALTSGLGYVAWYGAVRHFSSTRAAILQLLVPVLAALGGVLFLDEKAVFRLFVASVAVFGGVLLALSAGTMVRRESGTS